MSPTYFSCLEVFRGLRIDLPSQEWTTLLHRSLPHLFAKFNPYLVNTLSKFNSKMIFCQLFIKEHHLVYGSFLPPAKQRIAILAAAYHTHPYLASAACQYRILLVSSFTQTTSHPGPRKYLSRSHESVPFEFLNRCHPCIFCTYTACRHFNLSLISD
jgi:hypothetical protein